jgi:L,D-peptidoglycan transpeptidase YkuD (ErfK/YbiS/YcfS/YnhG family)
MWAMRLVLLALILALAPQMALAQSCPAPLGEARRLVLVTADKFSTSTARLQLFERDAPAGPWHARAAAEPALLGKGGMAWSYFFRSFSRRGEPRKVEGDKRVPAGFYRIGKSFGTLPPNRANYLHLTEGTTCVDDLNSAAYNTISSRAKIGWKVHGENMWRVQEYRRGLLIDYPTNAKARAGSCIFIHVRLPEKTGTAGCVALPQARVEALQDFAEAGAVLAILPKQVLDRFKGCLP